ncbi:TPA: adenosine deaminase [Legionella bozemanae]
MNKLIMALPKVELHIHIEGTLEPDLMFLLAKRNNMVLPYKNPEELHAAYQFTDLQSFLNLYYAGTNVLQTEEDFYDLTWAYMQKIQQQNVRHTEIFFDPQTHTARGIDIGVVIHGIHKALEEAKRQFNISSEMILCFLRDLPEEDALRTLERALTYQDKFIAVGLDSAERAHPPRDFVAVFAKARAHGLLTVAHAGEEGPAAYITEALELLKVSRIDHGVRCLEDMELVARLQKHQIPLTVCPLSNIKLCVFKTMKEHPIKKMLNMGLAVTINSDDPAYFSGYIEENYSAVADTFQLTNQELVQLARNSIQASFCTAQRKQQLVSELEAVIQNFTS